MTDEELAAKLAELGEALNSSVLGCLNQDGIGDTILLASSRLYALSAHVALLKASLAQAEREAEKPAASAEPVAWAKENGAVTFDAFRASCWKSNADKVVALYSAPQPDRVAELERKTEYAQEDFETLADEIARLMEANKKLVAHRDALTSEVERLRKDVERYRHLRDSLCCEGYPSSEGSSSEDAYLVITGYNHLYPMTSDQKDAAIDAAIAGVTGKEIPDA